MSALTSVMAVSWSMVSVNAERVLHLGLPRGVRPERVARRACRLAYSGTSSPAISRTALRALVLVLAQSLPPSSAQRRRFAADVARQLIERVHRHEQLVRSAARACSTRTPAPGTRAARRRPSARPSRRTGRCRADRAPPGRPRSAPAGRRRCGAWRPAACPRCAVTRLPVRSVSVMTTRLAPAQHQRRRAADP